MGSREALGQAADVVVIAILALVYVLGLTFQTLIAYAVKAGKSVAPVPARERGERPHWR